MLEYKVEPRGVNAHGSIAAAKTAQIHLETDPAGQTDAFNPEELMLVSVA